MKLIQNEAKCRKCDDTIYSANRHDFKTCKCGAISVDGGLAYIRRVGRPEDIDERSIIVDEDYLEAVLQKVAQWRKSAISQNDLAILILNEWRSTDYMLKHKYIDAAQNAVNWAIDTQRNDFGIVLAVVRVMRDLGILDTQRTQNF
jgi:hypothetical protein